MLSGNHSLNEPSDRAFEEARRDMVQKQLVSRGISDRYVLDAISEVPRHLFVPSGQREHAYKDSPLPIGYNQTISQPYIVAYMTQALQLSPDATVLEVGTGSGYQAAILSLVARKVYTIERHEPLARKAKEALVALGCDNVEVMVGDGTLGWPEHAPYDGIIVTAAAPDVPEPLIEQLAEGAALVAPIGPTSRQDLVRIRRRRGEVRREYLVPVAFVPLIGEYGWPE